MLTIMATPTGQTIDHQTDPKATQLQTALTITKTTVAMSHHRDQIMATDHPRDQLHQIQTTNVDHRTMPPHFGKTLHQTTLSISSATTVEELVTMQDNALLTIAPKTPTTAMEDPQEFQQTMKMPSQESKSTLRHGCIHSSTADNPLSPSSLQCILRQFCLQQWSLINLA